MLSTAAPKKVSTNAANETSTKRAYLIRLSDSFRPCCTARTVEAKSSSGEAHPRGVVRHLGAGGDPDPDVGGLDRRRVVDPVTGHRHHSPSSRASRRSTSCSRTTGRRRRSGRSAPVARISSSAANRLPGSPRPRCRAARRSPRRGDTSSPVATHTRMCALCASCTACLDSTRGGTSARGSFPTPLTIAGATQNCEPTRGDTDHAPPGRVTRMF